MSSYSAMLISSLLVSVLSHFSGLTLCDPKDSCNPMSVVTPARLLCHGILQARILEWVAKPFSVDLPDTGIEPGSLTSPTLKGGFFNAGATWEADLFSSTSLFI